jgi:ParB family chromosome partitioning protein
MLRLLDLPDEVLIMLRDGAISAGHARALLSLSSAELMIECAHKIIERSMSVREVESMVQRINTRRQDIFEEKVHPQIKAHMKELENRAMSALGRKVRISRSSHKKVLEITYSDDEDLEALLKSLCGDNIFAEV